MNCKFWNNVKFGLGFGIGSFFAGAVSRSLFGFNPMPTLWGCNSLNVNWLTNPFVAMNMWAANNRNYRSDFDNNLNFNINKTSLFNNISSGTLSGYSWTNVDTFNNSSLNSYSFNESSFNNYSFNNFDYYINNSWYNASSSKKASSSNSSKPASSGKDYIKMTRSQALEAAKNDSNLEELKGGTGWSIVESEFKNDIKYAKKGINKLLDYVAAHTDVTISVTSALGTARSPHSKNMPDDDSHYNSTNPKLDFGAMSKTQAERLEKDLKALNICDKIRLHNHGDGTAHLDVHFKDSAFETV